MAWSWKIIVLALLTLTVSEAANADAQPPPAQPVVIDMVGECDPAPDTTPEQARAIALNNARRQAIESAAGVEIRSSSVIYNAQLIQDLLASSSRGLITAEQILDERLIPVGREFAYRLVLRATVKPLPPHTKGQLKIKELQVRRYGSDTAMEKAVFQEGEELLVDATLNHDGWLYVFSIGQDGLIYPMYPNPYIQPELIRGENRFTFPSEELRIQGMKLRVAPPTGLSKAVESVVAIACEEPQEGLAHMGTGTATLTDLSAALAEIDPATWSFEATGYEVRR